MPMPRKYPPSGALETIEALALKGNSMTGLAKHFNVHRDVVGRWFEENSSFEEAYEKGRDSYRQALEEQIIAMTLAGKNPAGLIYLLKAKFKMYDQPNKNDTINVGVQVETQPVMIVKDHGTDEEWAAKCAEQQRRLTTSEPTINASLPATIEPIFTSLTQPIAPAWVPKSR